MTIFIDLDECLLHSVPAACRDAIPPRKNVRFQDGECYDVVLRQSAQNLLTFLRSLAPVRMLTTSQGEYPHVMSREFNLGFAKGDIISLEQIVTLVPMAYGSEWVILRESICPDSILIDNMDPTDPWAILKMKFLGIDPARYFQIREFRGTDPARFTRELAILKERVKRCVLHL